MFTIGETLDKMGTVPWAPAARKFHAKRWEYLHGRMHAAGYALDPEYLYTGDGSALDQATMEGLIEVVERLALRYIITGAQDPASAASQLTVDSLQVCSCSTLDSPSLPPPQLYITPQVQQHVGICMQQFTSFRQRDGIFTKMFVVDNAKVLAP